MKTFQKIFLVFAILTGIFIFYISSLSSPPNPLPGFSWTSIIYHFGVFAMFAFFLMLSLLEYPFLIFIFSAVYAGLDEMHQYFVPGRYCSIVDFEIDFLGILAGVFAFIVGRWILRKVFKIQLL